ncbi:MAG: hypothetical protein M9894_02260 [Planctomycetes bacterium]|nr:hypothetical protein [Planctomycetota bacterium]
MGGSLPIILFVFFVVALGALNWFLSALARMAARAEQERRARAREERERVGLGRPRQQPQAVDEPPPPARRLDVSPEQELLRQLLGLEPPPPPPRPRPRPRPQPQPRPQVLVARPVEEPRAASRQAALVELAPADGGHGGSLTEHHLAFGLAEHHLGSSIEGGLGARDATADVVAGPARRPLAALDPLPPMARALVLADVFGKPPGLAGRRTRMV